MANLNRFPALQGMYQDLTKLAAEETGREVTARQRGQPKILEQGDTLRLEIKGKVFWFAGPQVPIVRALLDGVLEGQVEVRESYLLSQAKHKGPLTEIFRGHSNWDEIISRGKGAGMWFIHLPVEE